jgi:hypothetical protein
MNRHHALVPQPAKKESPAGAGLYFCLVMISSENRFTLFRIMPLFDADLF